MEKKLVEPEGCVDNIKRAYYLGTLKSQKEKKTLVEKNTWSDNGPKSPNLVKEMFLQSKEIQQSREYMQRKPCSDTS